MHSWLEIIEDIFEKHTYNRDDVVLVQDCYDFS